MNVNGPIAYNHILAPYPNENFIPGYDVACAGNQKLKEFKLFTRQCNFGIVFYNYIAVFINREPPVGVYAPWPASGLSARVWR